MSDKEYWGRAQLMVTAAHRYCLGRSSYIVSDCTEWMLAHWNDFDKFTKKIIISETEEALENDMAGDEISEKEWREFLENVRKRNDDAASGIST